MATIVLGALGTLAGGPLGGMLGATLGRSLDARILGGRVREGPRLTELAVTTSSYGRPLPALYGRVRAAGTVIWASDLREHSETSGGKGAPRTTRYAYSVSLAVALSSRPIDALGRIWADGNLLRGAAGDLKTGGTLRLHTGAEDQRPDPLLAAALGARCPAHRGCAYVVFEDLALEDFGNRIPALSFEVFAGSGPALVARLLEREAIPAPDTAIAELAGFVHEGGSIAAVLAEVDRLAPLAALARDGELTITERASTPPDIPLLPPPAAWPAAGAEGDLGSRDGHALDRRLSPEVSLCGLRYYDSARDYQPGMQRTAGESAAATAETLEFPAVLAAADARNLLDRAALREAAQAETLFWRAAVLDPALVPGSVVRAPGQSGLWRIAAWEWRERGIELELVRHVDHATGATGATVDAGANWAPPDRLPATTSLRVFELPWDGSGASASVRRYAAVGASGGRWPGAALLAESGGTLVPLGSSASRPAVGGTLAAPLAPSAGLRFEPSATLLLTLENADATLEPARLEAIAAGANRLLVGDELLQFAAAEPLGEGRWALHGLLRGRGGTEAEALAGHAVGSAATLLDDRLVALPETPAVSAATTFAALCPTEAEPAYAAIERAGRSRQPPFPVHPTVQRTAAGALELGWTRRARGGWAWLDEVGQLLAEEFEHYEVGLGDPATPSARWATTGPGLTIGAAELEALSAAHAGKPLWVRQKGSFALSRALFLATLPNPA